MNNHNKYNLLDFLKDNKVQIPILQRDYVQGRVGEENVRNSFLFKLHSFLLSEKSSRLNLDFIFGYRDNEIFYPIDGQQRITTLWLLHIYLYGKKYALEENKKEEIKKVFNNFSYTTRNISSDICKKIVKKMCNYDGRPNKILSDSSIYTSRAKSDPTAKSIVKMLDTIHEKFDKIDNIDVVLERLNNIEFTVIDMDKYKLGESLYIKLNGRGRLLSAYENFKAWIMKDMYYFYHA